MPLKSLVIGLAGAIWAGIAGAPLLEAASRDFPARASKAEIAESCRQARGLAWGIEEDDGFRAGQYGCITNRSWVACDHHGNCTGGDGTTDRAQERRGRFFGAGRE